MASKGGNAPGERLAPGRGRTVRGRPAPVESGGKGLEIGRTPDARGPGRGSSLKAGFSGSKPYPRICFSPPSGPATDSSTPGDEADAFARQGVVEGRQPLDGVMIGEGDRPDAGGGQPVGQLGGRELAIAETGNGRGG